MRDFNHDYDSKPAIDVARQLRWYILDALEGMTHEQIANRLGLLPSAVNAFMKQKKWPLITCLWLAHELDVRVSVTVERETW